jgi:hypothetical protein
MTPQEQAMELISKFVSLGFTIDSAKQCALVCVNKILKHCYEVMKPFWEEVKQEIEKL